MDVIVDANMTATAGTFQLWAIGNSAQREEMLFMAVRTQD